MSANSTDVLLQNGWVPVRYTVVVLKSLENLLWKERKIYIFIFILL